MATTTLLHDDHIGPDVLDELVHRPATTLTTAQPDRRPGVYLIAYRGPLPLYHQLAATRYPVYAGKGDNLADRMNRHRANLAAVTDLHTDDLEARWLHTSAAQAGYYEALLHHMLRPLWNQPWLAGFGSRYPGAQRLGARTPAWSVLHPGRTVATGTAGVCHGHLCRQVAQHVHTNVPSYCIWPA
jgi:hypothetical protein